MRTPESHVIEAPIKEQKPTIEKHVFFRGLPSMKL